MEAAPNSSDPLEISIKSLHLYNRAWMLDRIPGMHNVRLIELQKSFGLLPLGSGNRHAPYLYRGRNIIEALEAEARYHRGNSSDENEQS